MKVKAKAKACDPALSASETTTVFLVFLKHGRDDGSHYFAPAVEKVAKQKR